MPVKFPNVLVLPEFANGTLTSDARSLLGFASQNATNVDVLAINCDLPSALSVGVSKVYAFASRTAPHVRAACASIAMLLSGLSIRYDAVFVSGSSAYHDALCRAGAVLNRAVITNVFEVVATDVFLRSACAAQLTQKIRTNQANPRLLSVNTALVKANPFQPAPETKTLQLLEFTSLSNAKFEVVASARPTRSGRFGCIPLSEASIVVAGGRAFGSASQFEALLVPLALKLNAALGATRTAVEAGIAPPECQIGQTGATIAPKIYVAFGISGAVQHMDGVRGSKLIIAVNNNPNAPIIKQSDFALVGDLFSIIPSLLEALA